MAVIRTMIVKAKAMNRNVAVLFMRFDNIDIEVCWTRLEVIYAIIATWGLIGKRNTNFTIA